ncbi:MAG TPA: flagellar biosynthesis anti-sigma factor FlgM [Steroidobacteraceae bacterium]
MANRIKGLDGGSIGSGNSNPIEKIRVSTAVSSAGADATSSANVDNVHITQSARSLAALSQAVRDTPDIDAGRVASVQQALDAGQYTIDPQRIAARLLQLEQDLGSAAQR